MILECHESSEMTEFSFLDEITLENAVMNGKLNHYERIGPIMAILLLQYMCICWQ